MKNKFMQRAIELSLESINSGGGPFGSVIVKDDKIISEGMNRVTVNNDPTAHGEIVAIRNACKELKTFNLSDCFLYSNCEPCPMCMSAIYWSHIGKVYYGNTRDDAKKIEFDDSFIYSEISKTNKDRSVLMEQILRDDALKAFEIWNKKTDKTKY